MQLQSVPKHELGPIFSAAAAADPKERKVFTDFRDRAAYTYVTGTFPTHLRTFFTALLRKATRYTTEPASFDLRGGHMMVEQTVVDSLALDDHPMVRKTREMIRTQGFRIQTARGVTERRPFSKVFLFKQRGRMVSERITVQVDGSIKEGW